MTLIPLVVLNIHRQLQLPTRARHFNQLAVRILGTDAILGFYSQCLPITAGREANPCNRKKDTRQDCKYNVFDFYT
jgi:hypothetical protein